jgi:DNA-binding transcriptional ArsR family regulator
MAWVSEKLLTAVGKAAPHECITEARMAELTGLSDRQVENAALKLRKHGLLEKTGQGCHTLTDAGREACVAGAKLRSGPRAWTGPKVHKDSLRTRVWRAMRLRGKFSIPDLEMLVAEGGEKDIASNIRKYLKPLEKAGYIIRMPKREAGTALTSNGHVRWWLLPEKDTGPQAPVHRKVSGTVYDPNTETEVSICG